MTIKELTDKAESGDAEAQYQLALIYFEGKAVDQNLTRAGMWFHQSAKNGNYKSFGWLSYLYETGIAVAQNYEISLQWLMKLIDADRSNARVCAAIAGFYYNGWGTKKNYSEAIKWCFKAASMGLDMDDKIFQIQCEILFEEIKSGTLQESDVNEKK